MLRERIGVESYIWDICVFAGLLARRSSKNISSEVLNAGVRQDRPEMLLHLKSHLDSRMNLTWQSRMRVLRPGCIHNILEKFSNEANSEICFGSHIHFGMNDHRKYRGWIVAFNIPCRMGH